jgi:hypothetical protein
MHHRLLLVALVLFIGCSTAQSPPRPDVGFYDRLFGRPANVTAVVRVTNMLGDPLYGPYLRKAFEKLGAKPGSLASALAHTDEVDLAASVTQGMREKDMTGVAVFYGVDDDPATIREGDDALFTQTNRLASGVVEYGVAHDHEYVLFAAHGAWIFAHGEAIERARTVLAESASPPPRLGLEPGALSAATITASALESDAADRKHLEGTARVVAESLDEAEAFLTRSSTGDFVTRFWLRNEDAAKILEGEMLAAMNVDAPRCDSTCKLVRAIIRTSIDVQRDGKYLSVRVHVSEAVLRKLL